jgi:hypothetical protein
MGAVVACGKSGGLGSVRKTTAVWVVGGGAGSEDLKTQPEAHAKTMACKASDRTTANDESLRGMRSRENGAVPETVRPAWAENIGQR